MIRGLECTYRGRRVGSGKYMVGVSKGLDCMEGGGEQGVEKGLV